MKTPKWIKKSWQWLTFKKKDVTDGDSLYFYHTKRLLFILAGFAVLSGLTATTLISVWRSGDVRVSVPNLIDQTVQSAIIELQKKNLVPRIKLVHHADKKTGIVINQNPAGGFFTREQRTITLFVNQEPKTGEAPNLIRKTPAEARRILAKLRKDGYNYRLTGIAYGFSDEIPAGRIISQTPPPGQAVGKQALLKLLVSKGPAHAMVTVADLRNRPVEQAALWASANNLSLQIVSGSSYAAQQPAPGSRIREGSLVTLRRRDKGKIGVFDFYFPDMLSQSYQELKRDLTGGTTSTNTNTRILKKSTLKQARSNLVQYGKNGYKVKLFIKQGNNRRLIWSGTKKPDQRLLKVFRYTGSGVILEMQINGKQFIEKRYR